MKSKKSHKHETAANGRTSHHKGQDHKARHHKDRDKAGAQHGVKHKRADHS